MTKKARKIEEILKVVFQGKDELVPLERDKKSIIQNPETSISLTDARIILENTANEDIQHIHEKKESKDLIDLVTTILFASHDFGFHVPEIKENKIEESSDSWDDLSDTQNEDYSRESEEELIASYRKFREQGNDESSVSEEKKNLFVLEGDNDSWPSDEEGEEPEKVSQSSENKPKTTFADSISGLAEQPTRPPSNRENKPKPIGGNEIGQRIQI